MDYKVAMTIVLHGPQRLEPTLAATLSEQALEGPLALVTAGWQEREREDEELSQQLGLTILNLELYHRAEAAFDADPELFAATRERQQRLIELQRLYRRRLDHAVDAYRELVAIPGESSLLAGERDAALEALRDLDRHHLARVEELSGEHDHRVRPGEREAVAKQRHEIADRLAECSAVVLSGGHVAVLLNRLRLFDLAPLLLGLPVLAYSAGAMALASLVVLFHDSPPWGAGNSEVLDRGLGLFPTLLPLPHARRRLQLADRERVAQLARRYAPLRCVGMNEGARVQDGDGEAVSAQGVLLLETDGAVKAVGDEGWQELAP